MGKYDLARQYFAQSVELKPVNNLRAMYGLLVVCRHTHVHPQAIHAKSSTKQACPLNSLRLVVCLLPSLTGICVGSLLSFSHLSLSFSSQTMRQKNGGGSAALYEWVYSSLTAQYTKHAPHLLPLLKTFSLDTTQSSTTANQENNSTTQASQQD